MWMEWCGAAPKCENAFAYSINGTINIPILHTNSYRVVKQDLHMKITKYLTAAADEQTGWMIPN